MNSSAASFPVWHITRGALALERPLVMGIINVTPDSFSDGGSLPTPAAALAHCERLLCDGADILDIGAESTRPGSCGISAEEELARLLPVLRSALRLGAPVSVDTSKPAVMRAALEAGADIINDVAALAAPGALEIIARHGRCGVCLMHGHAANAGQGAQQAPMPGGTDGAVQGVLEFFRAALARVQQAGVEAQRLVLDPGLGFGKAAPQSLALLARQRELLAVGRPLLIGASRKSFLAHAVQAAGSAAAPPPPAARVAASVAAALLAAQRGAAVLRVHDVRETVQALAVLRAVHEIPAN